jgi:hypothetical protein
MPAATTASPQDADEGYGAHLGGMVSQRWDWGTINWNLQGEYTRNHHADAFASAIIEGPDKWKVRPFHGLSFHTFVYF